LNVSFEGKLIPRFKIRTKKKVIEATVNQMELLAVNGTDYDGNNHYYLSYETCENIRKNYYKPSYINRYPSIQRCSSIMKKGSDIYWRIIRINGDGSIRMIYDGTVAHDNGVSHGNRVIYPNQIKFGNNSIAIYATSYAYKHPFSGELQYNEIVKTVNSWYATYFSEAGGQYVADAIYCNDRVEKQSYVDGSGKYFGDSVILEYAPAQRIRYKIPSLKCSNYSDRNTIGSNIGNGYLTYPVGLITADEVMLAGATMMIDEYGSFVPVGNTKYYLYSGTPYWTMSPINSYSTFSYMFSVGGDGELNSNLQYSEFGLKPVISLKNNISFTGTGTKEDPFIPTGFCN